MSRNQFSNRPPFCDFLERYQAAHRVHWSKSHLLDRRVGLGRFDEWLKVSGIPLAELDWQKLMGFHRFLGAHGVSPIGMAKSLQIAKQTLRWGIQNGELPQRIEDLYTSNYIKRSWTIDLPPLAQEFLSEIDGITIAAHRHHVYSQKVFHTFLSEKRLTYRKLRREHLAAYVRFLAKAGFAQQTRMVHCTKIRTFLKWLHEKKRMKRTVDEIFPPHMIPKPPKRLPRPLPPELDHRLQKVLEETDDLYYKAILLLRKTGLRIGELRLLEFDCIEYDPKNRPRLKVPVIKLGVERRVPLDPKTVELIHLIQKKSLQNYRRNRPPKRLVIGPKGQPPSYLKYSGALTELCARLNTKKWINLHSLRHTYATNLLAAGVSIVSLKEILGHKTIVMTLLYAKVTQEQIQSEYTKAIAQMDCRGIPELLAPRLHDTGALFSDLGASIMKTLDQSTDSETRKRLKSLLNRISKIKSELGQLGNIARS